MNFCDKKEINRVMDYFRNAYRTGGRVSKSKDGGSHVWLTDNYVAAKIPLSLMELNLDLFQERDLSGTIFDISGMNPLSRTTLIEYNSRAKMSCVPLKNDDFVFWVQKKYLDLFPAASSVFAKSDVTIGMVALGGEIIGATCPVRNRTDITLFM